MLLFPFSGLPRLLLYIKSQISGVRQTGALLSTALYLGVLLDVFSPSRTSFYVFLYFSALLFEPSDSDRPNIIIIIYLLCCPFYLCRSSVLLKRILLLFHNISPYRCRLLLISHSIASSLKICNNGNDLLLFKSWEICIL